jgi:putative phosphotransacetylase
VLGPSRRATQVELTPTEAALLGIEAPVARSGDLERAAMCRIETEHGGLDVPLSVIIPEKHLHLSDTEAKEARLSTGSVVRVDVIGDSVQILENVVVRVHPTYRARLHVHADVARSEWMHTGMHVRIRDLQT